jgi:hypothetical protein
MLTVKIQKLCLESPQLFCDLALATNKKPNTLLQTLKRNSSKELKTVDVMNVIVKHTGFSQEKIYSSIK